jgi:hypothetical protein
MVLHVPRLSLMSSLHGRCHLHLVSPFVTHQWDREGTIRSTPITFHHDSPTKRRRSSRCHPQSAQPFAAPSPIGAAVCSAIFNRRRSVQRHLQLASWCAAPSIGTKVSGALSNWRHSVRRHLQLAPQCAAPSQ